MCALPSRAPCWPQRLDLVAFRACLQSNDAQIDAYLAEESQLTDDVKKELATRSGTETPIYWGLKTLLKVRSAGHGWVALGGFGYCGSCEAARSTLPPNVVDGRAAQGHAARSTLQLVHAQPATGGLVNVGNRKWCA